MRSRIIGACLLFGVLPPATGAAPSADPQAAARAAAALAPFKQQLQAALQKGMVQGPEQALLACRAEAPRIAAAHGTPQLRMGRTSHRLRNPGNAPKAWMQPLLAHYQAHPEDRAPRAARHARNRLRRADGAHPGR